MELNKVAKFRAKNEPYLKPISDLGIGFYNLDENTATLQFHIYNDNGPLFISEENVDVHGYFESSNGSVSTDLTFEVVDAMNGVVQATLDNEFLQASTSSQVRGQIYIGLRNVDNKPEYNQTAVFGEFTFRVSDALINKVSSFTKIEYIRMFDKLRDEIKTRTKEMENNIGTIATLVNEVNTAVSKGTADINKIKNDAITEVENIASASNGIVKQEASQAVSDIQTIVDQYVNTLEDETQSKINQVNEQSDKVIASIKGNNLITEDQAAKWQKYKLTNDDGTIEMIERPDFTKLDDYFNKTGNYYVTTPSNSPHGIGYSGFVTATFRTAGYGKIEFQPYNSNVIYQNRRTGNSWSGWVEISKNITDTGWLTIAIKNGYELATIPDFAPSYRVIDYGTHKKVYIRLGVTNLVRGKNTVASIPQELTPYKKYTLGVSTNAKIPPKVIISSGEIEFHTNENDDYISSDYIIYQDEWII